MSETKIGYKVVTRVNKKSFKPATGFALQSIRYRLNEATYQDDDVSGAFAVFENLERAEIFFKCYGTAILEDEYVESDEARMWKKNKPNFVRNRYGKGYHAECAGISVLEADDCPSGTVFAEMVKPITIICED